MANLEMTNTIERILDEGYLEKIKAAGGEIRIVATETGPDGWAVTAIDQTHEPGMYFVKTPAGGFLRNKFDKLQEYWPATPPAQPIPASRADIIQAAHELTTASYGRTQVPVLLAGFILDVIGDENLQSFEGRVCRAESLVILQEAIARVIRKDKS